LKPKNAVFELGEARAHSDLVVSSVLHLMSHYMTHEGGAGANLNLAAVIERHLQELADAPDLAPVLRATCRQLMEQWGHAAKRTVAQPRRSGILARLFLLDR